MTDINDLSQDDIGYMARAIELAKHGSYSTKPNPAVGCVIVKNGQLIAEGWHQKAGQPHAERIALKQAGKEAEGSTVYVTLEPCSHHGRTPPCSDALIEAKAARVVVAMKDPNPLVAGRGIDKLQEAGILVESGVLEQESRTLNLGFLKRMDKQLPYVRLKIASSMDGRTAMESGESQWITGPESRLEVHKMRAQSGALITGIGTVLADDPSLNVRLLDEELAELNLTQETCHPIRVVLDPNLSMPLDAKMLKLPGRTILMTSRQTAERSPERVDELFANDIEMVAVSANEDRLDIKSILAYLAQEEQVNDVMVESGAIVAGAFIQSGLVDEVHCFMAPTLMGQNAKPMFALEGISSMEDKIQFGIASMDRFGADVRIVLTQKEQ